MKTAVYLLKCEAGAWYVGITEDLEARMENHMSGNGSVFTKHYRPLEVTCVAWMPVRGKAEFMECAVTAGLQKIVHKVAGGCYTKPSPSGRGVQWSEDDIRIHHMTKALGKRLVVNGKP